MHHTTPAAVLWDLDGTLIDSTSAHWQTWRDTLAVEEYGLTYERFRAGFGMRSEDYLRACLGRGVAAADVRRITDAKEARYREMVKAGWIAMLPGAREWLERLERCGWRQALATSSSRVNVDVILPALGLDGVFDAIVCAEDVEHGKPSPHVFLAAAARLGAEPARCVVVEDSPAGLEGARRAGMRTVGVLTTHAALHADLVVTSLDRLRLEMFESLVPEGAAAG